MVDRTRGPRPPEGVPFDQAAAATDAGLTSYHAVSVQGNVSVGSRVGIIGLGGLGGLGAQAALALGATLFVAEKNERLHGYARSLGAERVASDITDFAGEDLDVVIDFAGFGTTTDGAIHSVRRGGRGSRILPGASPGDGRQLVPPNAAIARVRRPGPPTRTAPARSPASCV